jgi:hypothetical protein
MQPSLAHVQEAGGGRRVMGMTSVPSIATSVPTAAHSLWEVPPGWSLAQAATVPVAYATACARHPCRILCTLAGTCMMCSHGAWGAWSNPRAWLPSAFLPRMTSACRDDEKMRRIWHIESEEVC